MSTSPPSAATVLEYMCLFTHDLRRKQKRWQDGRLKYHTFNKRVMVYDERGNFVGDMHWRHDYAFDEGEEIELERGGVIVQVSSLIGRKEADLSELLDKRVKEKEQRHLQKLARSPASAALPRPGPQPGPRPSAIPPDHFQLRHRPLHQVIGTPTGHHGKALVPKESPFEQRQQAAAAAAETPDGRAAKRRKHEDAPSSKSGYATALFGQSLTLSATPASSVPVRHRTRPELNSGPSSQADYPSAREDLDPVPREKQKMARHLNQKTGYAQGLFGQSLTLSHTPVSSVPPRSQSRHEPSSSSTLDAVAREDHDDTHPMLREKSKASCHFNQLVSKPQTTGSAKQSSANRKATTRRNDRTKRSISRGQSEERNYMARDHGVEELRHTTPEDEDVIVIDDPEPVQVEVVRRQRTEKDNQHTTRGSNQMTDSSAVMKSQQKASCVKSTSSRSVEQEDQQGSEPEERVKPVRRKKAKPVTTKAVTKKRTIEDAGPKTREDPTHSIAPSRRADEHVTELKLKSKKRGLLMISDAPKKPRRQATSSSARPSEGTESQDVRSIDRECKDDEHMKDMGRTHPQRTISKELGEFGDSFRSQSPAPDEMPVYIYEELRNDHDSGEHRERVMSNMLPEPDKELPDDEFVSLGEDAVLDQATTNHSPPPHKVYDPYRLPSSPEEEVPFSWPASSPGNKSPPNNSDPKKGTTDKIRDTQKAGDRPRTNPRAKQQRPSRRRFILDDTDTEDDTPTTNEAVPTKLAKSRMAEAKERKARTQNIVAESEVEADESVEATRQMAKQKQGPANPELQDEQSGKLRRSTRQKRHRVDESEEPALASESDVSEVQEVPKKRQRWVSKASDNRPRLERIKKNIKSRELVGFNLAALNAPLGPRGIGMPFSILSSPVNESIQRRMSNQEVTEVSSDPAIEDDDETSIPFDEDATDCGPNRVVVGESSTAGLNERPTTHTPSSPPRNIQSPGHITKNEILPPVVDNAVGTRHVQAQPDTVATGVDKQLAAQHNLQEAATASGVPNTMNDRPDATETNDSTGPIISQGHHIAVGKRAKDCDTTKVQAKTRLDPAVSTVSSDSPPAAAQKSNRTAQEQRPTPSEERSQDIKAAQVALEPTENSQMTEAPVITSATYIDPLQASMIGLQRRPSTSEGANVGPGAQESKAETTRSTGSDEYVTTVARVTQAAPVQEHISAIRERPSTTVQEDGAKSEGAHGRPVSSEDIRVEQSAGPATRPRVTAPFKRPTPTIRRQPSTTTAANQIDTSSPGEEPDPVRDVQRISAHGSAGTSTIDAPLQKPTLAPVRSSSNGKKNAKEKPDTPGEKPETNTAAPDTLIQRQNSFGLRRPTVITRSVNNITGVRTQADAPENRTADSAAKAAVKIVNPASRGRKAALASDAVGQVPQRVLPPNQHPLLVPISTADLACTSYEPPPPKEPKRPKRKMKFPGFQSAKSEGPWSREAFDLLETGRPG